MRWLQNRESSISRQKLLVFVLIGTTFYFLLFNFSYAAVQDEIAERQRQIESIEKEIAGLQQQIAETQGQSRTLQNEVNVLNAQIRQIELGIRSLELSIRETSFEIGTTQENIQDIEEKVSRHKEALSQFIKLIDHSDNKSLTEVLLSYDDLSDFFNALNDIKTNQENLQSTINEMKTLKIELETHQLALEEKLTELDRARKIEALERQRLSQSRVSVDRLLKETKGQEATFQQMVQRSQKDLDAIRAQIKFLVESGITAEEAVRYAQLAAVGTGIRPAFLLALLEYETGLGRNVGKCNIVDATSGASRHIETGKVSAKGIHPTRDLPILLSVADELGRDPFQLPISCWPGYGYGGAMGPAQFIPSTWVGYEEDVSRITGHHPVDPWNFEDAFTASALYLARRGATAQTRASEIAAAKAYISGNSKCSTSACNRYANGIQNIAAELEKNL
ncbi:MAG: lytic murein transglycosylase [Candidatus Yanofskybacteria bacterium]|nr:lytic murein transglycosylase [Candidatus Yanofskybacteria bacterium]